jgi:predicted acetyltransferase
VPAEIRSVTSLELADYVAALEVAAGRSPNEGALEDARRSLPLHRTFAAFDDGRIVAGTGSDELELTVPGLHPVPSARVTLTGTLPTHRRRGLVMAMMGHQLRALRDLGNPLAIFTTSGPGIYGRLGYRPATYAVRMEVPTGAGLFERAVPPGTVRVVDPGAAMTLVPQVFDDHRRLQPGQVERRQPFWEMWLLDRELFRPEGASPRFFAVFEDEAGDVRGYVCYRLTYGPLREQPVQALLVEDLIWTTDDARLALWSYCVGFEQAAVVHASNLPVDDPLAWALADPRRVRTTGLRDFLWVRLVDVAVALAGRSYADDGAVVFDVTDSTCAQNCGRFRLESVDGRAGCERTSSPPDLIVDVGDLGSTYLGAVSFSTLARAGRLTATSPAALRRADAMFASVPSPWTVTDW